LLHQGLKHHGLVALSHRKQERHWFATLFTPEMDFRTEAPLTVAQGFFLGLTTTGSSRMLMRSNHTAINKVELSAKLARSMGLLLQLLQNLLPKPSFSPGVESSLYRFPSAILVWQISPGRPSAQDPTNAINRDAMVIRGSSPFRARFRHQGL
jgi:hypothetical protein